MNRFHVNPQRRQQGFSLIEAMIAVVVLATGLLALTALQGALMRSSVDAKARSLLVAYGQSEMDRLRLGGVVALASSNKDSASAAAGDPIKLAAAAAGLGAVEQTVTVTQYVATGGVFAESAADPEDAAYFKKVDLTLTWDDATGGDRSLRMSTVMSPLTLTASKVLVDREPPEDAGLRPVVRRPIPLTEGMIPIALGDNQDTAATNPRPELVGRDNDTPVADTRFEVLTYDGTDNLGLEGNVRFNKRIETAMVGCTCQTGLGGFPTGGSSAAINELLDDKAFRPTYWDGIQYAEPEGAGTPTRSPDPDASQSQLCDVCCRDHEDPAGVTGPKFNPWLGGAAHNHYDENGALVATGTFKEACRIIRVEGVWRVAADPRAEDISLVATREYPETTGSGVAPTDNNRATSPLVATAGKNAYVNFVYDFIKQFFYDKTALTDAQRMAMQAAAGLNNPDYVPLKTGDTRWLHSRAILADFLEPDAVERIQQAIDECTATTLIGSAQCVLPYVPMATINVTDLARWGARETSETGIVLSGSLASSITNFAQAVLNRFVSALALAAPISPTDDDNPIKDEQTFALTPGVIKSGTWLSVASPAGVIFGDPANPTRGFATMGAPIHFDATFTGHPLAHDNNQGNDFAVNVGVASPVPCSHGGVDDDTNHDSPRDPFDCESDSSSNVVLAFGGNSFNYKTSPSGNTANPCTGGTGNVARQPQCNSYSLTQVMVDGATYAPAAVNYTLVSGTLGKPSEISSITIPAINTSTPVSSVMLTFSQAQTPATPVCNAATFVQWSCD